MGYIVSESPIINKSYKGIKWRKMENSTPFQFFTALREGHAVNAMCRESLKSAAFDGTQFICMDFDNERMGFDEFHGIMRSSEIPPTITHSSCSDGLTLFDDGSVRHKYHCYWVFGDMINCAQKRLYTGYLLHKFPNADGSMKNKVQWSGGMLYGISEEEIEAKSRMDDEMWSSEDLDDIISKSGFVHEEDEKTEERCGIDGCWAGEHRQLRLPLCLEYDEYHTYTYREGEGEVREIVTVGDNGKRIHTKLCDGHHRRKTLFSVACRYRINGGDEDGTRVGYEELLHNLMSWALRNVVFGDKVDKECVEAIAREVISMSFASLKGNVKSSHKIDMGSIRMENAEREARGEEKIHYNKYLSMSRNKEFDSEVMRLLKGHYSDKPKEQLSILKEFGMEITRYELYGVRNRHSDVFPKKPSREDILDILADCEDITVKGRLNFLEETYGVRITRQTLYNCLHPATNVKGCRK